MKTNIDSYSGARSEPFTYLGIPIHHGMLTKKEWKIIEDRFEKKTKLLQVNSGHMGHD